MLQKLLLDRFSIKVRKENRESPVYALVVRKDSPKMDTAENAQPDSSNATLHDGFTAFGIPAAGRSGFRVSRATMAMFADLLTTRADRPVVDMTKLEYLVVESAQKVPTDN